MTWHHLIRLTMEELSGRAKLSDLGDRLAAHPKAKKNRISESHTATAYEHPGQYIPAETASMPELCRGHKSKQEAEISMKITKKRRCILNAADMQKRLRQIQEATRRDKTTYEMDGAPITRDEAVTRLGRLDYLSGIARVHFTSQPCVSRRTGK